jgi:hypothetical protein
MDGTSMASPAVRAALAVILIVQVHSPEMVTVEATEAAAERLREAIGSIYLSSRRFGADCMKTNSKAVASSSARRRRRGSSVGTFTYCLFA